MNWQNLAIFHAALVTPSACEAGLGELRGGDVLGLNRGFLAAPVLLGGVCVGRGGRLDHRAESPGSFRTNESVRQ